MYLRNSLGFDLDLKGHLPGLGFEDHWLWPWPFFSP